MPKNVYGFYKFLLCKFCLTCIYRFFLPALVEFCCPSVLPTHIFIIISLLGYGCNPLLELLPKHDFANMLYVYASQIIQIVYQVDEIMSNNYPICVYMNIYIYMCECNTVFLNSLNKYFLKLLSGSLIYISITFSI